MVRRIEAFGRPCYESSGHLHLQASAWTSFPPPSPTFQASSVFTAVGGMEEAHWGSSNTCFMDYNTWIEQPPSHFQLIYCVWGFFSHLPSSAARLNYIIYKTVEDLWTPLMLGAVWLEGTASSPVETYTHQRLSMQKIEETQCGGQRRFCAMKMVHKGPLRREINVSWLKRACCDGVENVSGTGAQMWGGWMNVSGIPWDLQPESKLCQKCTCKYASLNRVCV